MKNERQQKILELIRARAVETQEELLGLLKDNGFSATQATVSRDIRDLRLVKALGGDGKYRYTCAEQDTHRVSDKFHSLFSDAVIGVDYAGNIVVVKCLIGMAMAVCAAMDSLEWPQMVGTLAGDDTFICIVRTERDAAELTAELQKLRK